jgi:hypothetical protein
MAELDPDLIGGIERVTGECYVGGRWVVPPTCDRIGGDGRCGRPAAVVWWLGCPVGEHAGPMAYCEGCNPGKPVQVIIWCHYCRMAGIEPAPQMNVLRIDTIEPDWHEQMAELAEESVSSDVGPLRISRWGGVCPCCGLRWEAGDYIAWSPDEGKHICADCARS